MSMYQTFSVSEQQGVAWVTFDNPPVNILSLQLLDDLDSLAAYLEQTSTIKVVVFQSAHPEIFIAHADTTFLKEMSTEAVSREDVELLPLQRIIQRISELPQATIAKIEGFARGGGHEFMLACDMRFAARGKAKFMQMEVAMGLLPCGGGASRMARQAGLGRALEVILGAQDFDANEAERIGTINRALDANEIGAFVENLANRIAHFPLASIKACKRAVYASIDKPIEEALREEAYWLYQSMSQTLALKLFQEAHENEAQFDMDNQRNWHNLIMGMQAEK
ncbi:enoyl-CoA hydratase/isomerase family protein [Vibrio viridaestus]|uniref:Enoyl-CoA hydratase/isomerase family protein n=1 Tax=Vibrio viridaestus TaxID=2487322 RepID=A0A3N9TJU0_9VIBR|nr:enoyl-CoA hydratase/isomerase family protein [Vibrio viridaestus]RQW64599.1 enoyl-CoA hydratase/isomerase family protein [Vibrio viridaestus]